MDLPVMATVPNTTTESIPPATTTPTTSPTTNPTQRRQTGWIVAVTLAAVALLILLILYAVDVM
jgi:hypothetical protein